MPTWCVSIALVHDGEIEIGVIYDPNVDELYAARRGGGTYLNGVPQPVPPAQSLKAVSLGPAFHIAPRRGTSSPSSKPFWGRAACTCAMAPAR
jgi:myo-inositol-1(or 4)-monophosphatase